MSSKRFFTLLFFCAFLFVWGCKAEPEHAVGGRKLPAVKVRLAPAAMAPFARPVEIAGTVEAVQAATIAAKVVGVIEEMPVVLGSRVEKGALLVKIGAAEIAAGVSRAEARLSQATRDYEREKRLLAKEAAAPETVKSLAEQHRLAEAGFREAKALQAYTEIRAPFAGQITGKTAKVGDLATVGAPLLVVENNARLQIVAAAPEALAVRIKPGDTLPLSIPAAQFAGTGVVAEMAPAADSNSHTFQLKLALAGADKAQSGQYARVGLPGAVSPSLMVPLEAVTRLGQMERVFVARQGRAELRLVRTGEQQAGQVEIVSGLVVGEQVVVSGGGQLQDGQPVQVEPY
ncbi:efflux RND transporter periplasmic adaptor subunit [Thiovibrio sp. JS02]